jgi:hypothetical protein
MTRVTDIHDEAMRFAEEAFVAEMHGEHSVAKSLFRKAFEFEREAAEGLFARLKVEPTRSVLCRSAAALAIKCGEQREAERLIAIGLAGRPTDEIAEELRALLQTNDVLGNRRDRTQNGHRQQVSKRRRKTGMPVAQPHRPSAETAPRSKRLEADAISIDDLVAAKRLIDQLGGVDKVKIALSALERLR